MRPKIANETAHRKPQARATRGRPLSVAGRGGGAVAARSRDHRIRRAKRRPTILAHVALVPAKPSGFHWLFDPTINNGPVHATAMQESVIRAFGLPVWYGQLAVDAVYAAFHDDDEDPLSSLCNKPGVCDEPLCVNPEHYVPSDVLWWWRLPESERHARMDAYCARPRRYNAT